uniref:Myosin motor domain-containing protein n=1 Tax=Hymenolepis diminuta TaxID=6216 RepID=A0A0R3S934_HYMDI
LKTALNSLHYQPYLTTQLKVAFRPPFLLNNPEL